MLMHEHDLDLEHLNTLLIFILASARHTLELDVHKIKFIRRINNIYCTSTEYSSDHPSKH